MAEISPALYRAGSGEPLLLLHGFTGAWHHWRPLLGELVARYEVIAPALAGHDGGMALPAGMALNFAGSTDLLEDHLDELALDTVHVVGNSMGGALALELAKRGRARSVVAPLDALQLAQSSLKCTVASQVIDALTADGEDLALGELERIACPVLLASPQFDRVLPAERHAPRFRREIPGVEYVTLAGCGHVPMWDDAHLVTRTITEFVDRHAAGAAPAVELVSS